MAPTDPSATFPTRRNPTASGGRGGGDGHAREGIRPPVQERSRKTLDRIVRAALELMVEKGVEGASVQDIVDRAGSSVGSFYARFDGKADLVRYLDERVWTKARERWDEGVEEGRWADADLPALLRGLVELLFRIERTDADRRRALQSRGGATDTSAGAEAFRDHIARDVRALLVDHRDEIGHPDPERAVGVLLPVLVGAVRELDAMGSGGAGSGGDDGLAEASGEEGDARQAGRRGGTDNEDARGDRLELVRLALGYLGSDTEPDLRDAVPEDAGLDEDEAEEDDVLEGATMDFFDVWE